MFLLEVNLKVVSYFPEYNYKGDRLNFCLKCNGHLVFVFESRILHIMTHCVKMVLFSTTYFIWAEERILNHISHCLGWNKYKWPYYTECTVCTWNTKKKCFRIQLGIKCYITRLRFGNGLHSWVSPCVSWVSSPQFFNSRPYI